MDKQLIIISGVSGAGKTTADIILEDLGYRTIDQFPTELLTDLVDLLEKDKTSKYSKVAMTINLMDLEKYENLLTNASLKPVLILIDASFEEIINRYKFTRRVHPLLASNKATTLEEAVEIEKVIIEKYKNRNCHIIDTTNTTIKEHKIILEKILKGEEVENLAITFESFGFKNNPPKSADIIIDTRILDNPFYVEELKSQTGLDKPVEDFVMSKPKTKEFLNKVIDLLDFTFKAYDSEEKRHITVCIGCTGGQHRSVVVTNYLYEHYKDEYLCYIYHRELGKK